MFKKLTGRLTLTTLLLAGFLLAQGQANAAIECRFGSGSGGTTTLTGGTGAVMYFKPVGESYGSDDYTQLGTYDATLSPELTSHCSNGNDGENLNSKSVNAIGFNGEALYPTNVSNVYYSVKIYSSAGGGYFAYSNDSWTVIDPDQNNERWNNQTWKAQVTLFQTKGAFTGNVNHVSYITPKDSRTIGYMAIGDPNDSNNQPWTFNVTPSSFSIPVAAATCQAAMVNNGTNNVDFGDFMSSSLRDGYWPTVPFTLNLKNCSNLVGIRYKVTASKTSKYDGTGRTMLGNTLSGAGASSGVGVEIEAGAFESSDPTGPYINDANYIFAPFSSVSTSVTHALGFNAYMRKDGNAVVAGNYKGVATFIIEYQ